MDACKRMTYLLAKDLISYKTSKEAKPPPINSHAMVLRRAVDRIEEYMLLRSMARKMRPFDEESLRVFFNGVCHGTLNDGHPMHWGIVVSIFGFATSLAEECNTSNDVPVMTQILAEVLEDHLTAWIFQQGGWEAFDLRHEAQRRDYFWEVMFGLAGFGALAFIIFVWSKNK